MGLSKSKSSSLAIELGGQAQADNQSVAQSAQQSGFINTNTFNLTDNEAVKNALNFAGEVNETARDNFLTVNETFGNIAQTQGNIIDKVFAFNRNAFDKQNAIISGVTEAGNENVKQVTQSFAQALTGVNSEAQNKQQKFLIVGGLVVVVVFGLLIFRK